MRPPISYSGTYPEVPESLGGRTFPVFGTINEAANQSNPNSRMQFGDCIIDRFGNQYCYVRATGSLAVGQVVRSAYPGDGDVPAAGAVSASTTTKRIFSTITTTLDESLLQSFLSCPGTSGGAGQTFLKLIKGQVAIGSNTTFDISKVQVFQGIGQYDGDALAAIPATADALVIVRPYNVVVAGIVTTSAGAEGSPVGIALGTVTAAGGTLIQTSGTVAVLAVGSTDPVVAGGPVVTAASGTVKGHINTASVAGGAEALSGVVGRSYVAWTSTSHLIPVKLSMQDKL